MARRPRKSGDAPSPSAQWDWKASCREVLRDFCAECNLPLDALDHVRSHGEMMEEAKRLVEADGRVFSIAGGHAPDKSAVGLLCAKIFTARLQDDPSLDTLLRWANLDWPHSDELAGRIVAELTGRMTLEAISKAELAALAAIVVARTDTPPTGTERERASAARLFSDPLPDNPDVIDLAVRIDSQRGTGKSLSAIALEFKRGDKGKAQSLLATIRRLRREGRLNLPPA